jgi:hypothetical protein
MKQTTFKQCPLKNPELLEGLLRYYDDFPNGQALYNGKSRVQRYEFPTGVVFIYETKTKIDLELRE